MQKGSSLNVSGASAGSDFVGLNVSENDEGGNGGGGGGVVQIIASSVDIRNISLAGGGSLKCTALTEKRAENGFLTIKSKLDVVDGSFFHFPAIFLFNLILSLHVFPMFYLHSTVRGP